MGRGSFRNGSIRKEASMRWNRKEAIHMMRYILISGPLTQQRETIIVPARKPGLKILSPNSHEPSRLERLLRLVTRDNQRHEAPCVDSGTRFGTGKIGDFDGRASVLA